MLNLWGHGEGAALGGHPAPGVWMLGMGMRLLERSPPGTLFADLCACNAYADASGAAARIRCPALLICGERDRMTPLSGGRELAALILGAHLTVLRDSGHMLLAERAPETREALGHWLKGLPDDAAARTTVPPPRQ